MTLSFAAIVPALNEAATISRTLESIRAAGIDEIFVSDGGSSDETLTIADAARATIIQGGASRGDQIANAFELMKADVAIVVHADTTIPARARAAISSAIASGHEFGGFSLRFRESDRRLRVAETMINFRSRLLREPWGDQAQWFRREIVERCGGFPRLPLMEDYTLARTMKRETRPIVLREAVETSGRRFLRRGLLGTACRNWSLIVRYRLGADPADLAKEYRS